MSTDGTALILRTNEIDHPEKVILDFFYEINPRVLKLFINEGIDRYSLEVRNVKPNPSPNNVMRYNSVVEIHSDGCLFSADSKPIKFSYGRWDMGRMMFKETGTIGVPDVPFQVETNDEEGVKKAFYGLVDNLIFVQNHPQYPDVKEWRAKTNKMNLIAIFTKWVGEQRVYMDEFTIFSKAYNPKGSFEDSDFVE